MELLTQISFPLFALLAGRWWFRRFRKIDIAPLLCKVAVPALLAGRLAFILTHYAAYASAPSNVFDLGDGGFSAAISMFVAFAIGTECTRQSSVSRPALAIVLAGSVAAWGAAVIALAQFAAAPMALPDVLAQLGARAPAPAGRPVVVNLWATWCPPCRREMPLLGDAQARTPGTLFVFVNQGEQQAAIRHYLDEERLSLQNVVEDRLSKVGRKTNSTAFPTTLFFDRHGVLVSRHVGALTAESLAQELARVDASR